MLWNTFFWFKPGTAIKQIGIVVSKTAKTVWGWPLKQNLSGCYFANPTLQVEFSYFFLILWLLLFGITTVSGQIWWSTYVIWQRLFFFFFFFLNTGCLSWCNPPCFIWARDQQLGMHRPMSDGFSVMSEDQLIGFGNEKNFLNLNAWEKIHKAREIHKTFFSKFCSLWYTFKDLFK